MLSIARSLMTNMLQIALLELTKNVHVLKLYKGDCVRSVQCQAV